MAHTCGLLGFDKTCPALKQLSDGRYSCDLLEHPNDYFDLGEPAEWKSELLKKLISCYLGIGWGCSTTPEVSAIHANMRKALAEFKATT